MHWHSIIAAGSEELATHLSGCMFCLCTHLQSLKRLTQEIRSACTSETDITLSAASDLSFLAAVIEAFRMYSPVITSLTRVVQPGGDTLTDRHVPGGVGPEFLLILYEGLSYVPNGYLVSP